MTNPTFALQLKKDNCTQCGICAESCPFNAIVWNEFPQVDPYACRLCGTCVQVCPSEAWTMEKDTDSPSVPATAKGIWVLAETENRQLAPVTKELLGKARELGSKLNEPVEVVLAGHEVSGLANELAAYGAQKIHLLETEALNMYIEENYAQAIAGLVRKLQPEILLVGATPRGRGLSARLAALLQTGLTADCTQLDIDPQTRLLHQIRPAFGGNLMATIATPVHRPQMASVRPGIMHPLSPDTHSQAVIIRHDLSGFQSDSRIQVLKEFQELHTDESLSNSRIIIGIGRGVKRKETVEQIREWGKRIGATLAGSRAAVEAGLIDAHLQIGQTGHTVSPDLYIAIGISGQIQHTSAIEGAKKIIAINPDATAPIFGIADYGWTITAEEAIKQLSES